MGGPSSLCIASRPWHATGCGWGVQIISRVGFPVHMRLPSFSHHLPPVSPVDAGDWLGCCSPANHAVIHFILACIGLGGKEDLQ
jgi:hypothetical protein